MAANLASAEKGFKLKTRASLKGDVLAYELSDDNDEKSETEVVELPLNEIFPDFSGLSEITRAAVIVGTKTQFRGRLGSKAESLDEAYETAMTTREQLLSGIWAERGERGEDDLILAMVEALPTLSPEYAAIFDTAKKARRWLEDQVAVNLHANGLDPESEDEQVQKQCAKVRREVNASIAQIPVVAAAKSKLELARVQKRHERAAARVQQATGASGSVLLGGIAVKL